MKKIAFVTQTYKPDFPQCKLLCKSMDLFADSFDHYIFVNDEDFKYFSSLNYGRHHILKKSTILPWYFIRIPFKILGHHFYVSPFTMPMREWIMQQICKLGIFDVIGDSYDAVLNIDSESVFFKPFDINVIIKGNKYRMYRTENTSLEVAHNDYCKAIVSFFNNSIPEDILFKFNYMDMPMCFERTNLTIMLSEIAKNNIFKSWKFLLANTYRFSENYTYGNFCANVLNNRNHFITSQKIMPVLQACNFTTAGELLFEVNKLIDNNPDCIGVVLQKADRKANLTYLNVNEIEKVIMKLSSAKIV